MNLVETRVREIAAQIDETVRAVGSSARRPSAASAVIC